MSSTDSKHTSLWITTVISQIQSVTNNKNAFSYCARIRIIRKQPSAIQADIYVQSMCVGVPNFFLFLGVIKAISFICHRTSTMSLHVTLRSSQLVFSKLLNFLRLHSLTVFFCVLWCFIWLSFPERVLMSDLCHPHAFGAHVTLRLDPLDWRLLRKILNFLFLILPVIYSYRSLPVFN